MGLAFEDSVTSFGVFGVPGKGIPGVVAGARRNLSLHEERTLAVKIVRQPNKIALIGAPCSAAGFALGTEKAPAALRAAGLIEKLQAIGYEVNDLGDCAPRLFADDDEHKRARNIPEIVAALHDLKPRVEVAAKSGALILVLGGDCVQCVALLTGARRYYKHISLLWCDRDADLNTPASTPSGRLDGMALAGIIGKGSPELVRFWSEPPLVREPDTVVYGLVRVDPPEQEFLSRSPMRHVYAVDIEAKGATESAQSAISQLHADSREFMLHLDLDVIAQGDFAATTLPDVGGLSLASVQASLTEFLKSKNLLGLDVAQYNPEKDPDSSGARKVVDLLVEAFRARFAAFNESAAAPSPSSALTIEAPSAEPAAEPGADEPSPRPLNQEPSIPETTPPEPTTTEPALPNPETPEPSAPELEPAPPSPETPQPESPETSTDESQPFEPERSPDDSTPGEGESS
jgi:arginase